MLIFISWPLSALKTCFKRGLHALLLSKSFLRPHSDLMPLTGHSKNKANAFRIALLFFVTAGCWAQWKRKRIKKPLICAAKARSRVAMLLTLYFHCQLMLLHTTSNNISAKITNDNLHQKFDLENLKIICFKSHLYQ